MRRHLTERELIEYRFNLASENRVKEIAAHLQECGDCSGRLEELNRKFSALDLLRGEVEVSEELISKALSRAEQPVRAKKVHLKKLFWIGAAAAAFLVGAILFVSQAIKEHVPGIEHPVRAEAKADEPPFAPASAIELVTLPKRQNVQLTIYNSADLTLVRERRNLTLKKGWNWLQFMWANTLIDPTSLSLEPLEQKEQIHIEQLVYPARLKDVGRWLIRSDLSGRVPFEITYFTSGLYWRAFYMGTLSVDEKKMQLQGYVRVGNASGEDYENAQTRLIVGKVHILDRIAELARRQYPHGRPGLPTTLLRPRGGTGGGRLDVNANALDEKAFFNIITEKKEIIKEGLSEYFLYTIEGTETIPDKWGKRLLSFEAKEIPVKSLYKYDEERWGTSTIRYLSFSNDEEHKLGQTPIPNGTVKIYRQADEEGYLSYVGGTSVKYIPVDEEVELSLGPARQVMVKPILMDFKTENYMFDDDDNISGWDEVRTWKIGIVNTRTLPVEIEITRGFKTAYWTLATEGEGVSYTKHDVSHARFRHTLAPRSKREFTYTVRTYHGTREESAEQ